MARLKGRGVDMQHLKMKDVLQLIEKMTQLSMTGKMFRLGLRPASVEDSRKRVQQRNSGVQLGRKAAIPLMLVILINASLESARKEKRRQHIITKYIS